MITKIKIIKEVEMDKVIVNAGVRYWNDCKYSKDNGQTWRDGSKESDTDDISNDFKDNIPNIENKIINYDVNDYWTLVIDINTGKVENWPKNYCISTWFKVCDDGLYQIVDKDGDVIWDSIETENYYVPEFLKINDNGYGDYINLDIDGNGYIKNWVEKAIPAIKKLFKN